MAHEGDHIIARSPVHGPAEVAACTLDQVPQPCVARAERNECDMYMSSSSPVTMPVTLSDHGGGEPGLG